MSNIFEVTGRYMDGKRVAGYAMLDSSGNTVSFDRNTLIKYCISGVVTNCRAVRQGDSFRIEGIGYRLRDLPSIKITGKSENILMSQSMDDIKNISLYLKVVAAYVFGDSGGLSLSHGKITQCGIPVGCTIQNISKYVLNIGNRIVWSPNITYVFDNDEVTKLMMQPCIACEILNATLEKHSDQSKNPSYYLRYKDGLESMMQIQVGELVNNKWQVQPRFKSKFGFIDKGEVRNGTIVPSNQKMDYNKDIVDSIVDSITGHSKDK